ncbi:MAG TPA: NAD(P)-dependent alcohol dehydrogenase [Euzebyales bacterium]|nr:NAD(P)-dependent alcohol dehydrogenase [Euzebyales bacterium]
MKAAVHTSYGPPEVVHVREVAAPSPGGDEVLVKVHATTVNRTDCGLRGAKPFISRFFTGLLRPRATILGNEFAGEVVAVGDAVTRFGVGDRVFGYVDDGFGAHAEYLAVPEGGSLATIPADLSYAQAAPSTEGSHYALVLVRAARISGGQRVLVYGATGAIGSAAVQILKSLGAEVTAVCATAHVTLVKELGADRVIDRTVEDFTADSQTYDVVIDAVGKSSFGRCRRLLDPGGIYLSTDLGPFSQNPLLALVTPLLGGRKVMFPLPTHDQEMVRYFRRLLESGEFRPVVDRRYPLDQIVEAYRYVETGQKVGNVVITVTAEEAR